MHEARPETTNNDSPATSIKQPALRTREGDQAKAAAVRASPRHLQLIDDLHGPHLHVIGERGQQGLMGGWATVGGR